MYSKNLILLVALLVPTICKAETACPWLNKATASDALNGSVNLELQNNMAKGDTCLFRYRRGTVIHSLRIAVQEMKNHDTGMTFQGFRCSSHIVPLKGIGNVAVLCDSTIGFSHGEQVIGYVRNKVFVVSIVSSGADQVMTNELIQKRVENIAEQVAGSLF